MDIITVEPRYESFSHWGLFDHTFISWQEYPPSQINDAAREYMISLRGDAARRKYGPLMGLFISFHKKLRAQ